MTLLVCLLLCAGCASMTTYVKPEAPWDSIHRVAVLPFAIPSENPMRRQLVTQLFSAALRRSGLTEVAEVPINSTLGLSPTIEEVAKNFQADAVFSGSIDDTQGTLLHVWLQDAATKEILWSGTYLVGVGSELFSLKTQQQQIQKAIARLVSKFTKSRG